MVGWLVSLFACLLVCLYVCLFVCLFVCLCVSLLVSAVIGWLVSCLDGQFPIEICDHICARAPVDLDILHLCVVISVLICLYSVI